MKPIKFIIVILILLPFYSLSQSKNNFAHKYPIHYQETILPGQSVNSIILETEYASGKIINTYAWERKIPKVFELIYVAFSLYPEHISDWKIPFDTLLSRRLNSLYSLSPELKNQNIPIEIIFQTKCKDKSCAENLFHGLILKAKHISEPNSLLSNFFTYNSVESKIDTIALKNGHININYGCTGSSEGIMGFKMIKDNFYIANSTLGMFCSKDSGKSFYEINNGLSNVNISCLEVFKDRLILGTREGLFLYDEKQNIWKEAVRHNKLFSNYIKSITTDQNYIWV